MQVRKKKLELDIEQNRLVPNGERSTSRLYIVTLLIWLICRIHHAKCQAARSTSGSQDAERNINNLRYRNNSTLMAEIEEELESLDEGERREWKSWLKTQHSENEDHGVRSHHSMANRWGNNGNSEKLHFWGLQNHCRWWLQPWNEKMLAPWKKSYDQLDNRSKSRQKSIQSRLWFFH